MNSNKKKIHKNKINKKKIHKKKIYLKKINIKNLKFNILNILKKKYKYTKKEKKLLLTNDGIYLFNNDFIQKYEYISKILNETEDCIEMNQYNKFKKNIYQIPFEHTSINITSLSFNINDNNLIFEIIDNKINDFYIQTNNNLTILDALMINEISYIKNLII